MQNKKYLFFDQEFASTKGGTKICEFGYIVTDERFGVIERGNMIIDPCIASSEWDYYALKKILTRQKKEYEAQPGFKFFYPRISKLIASADLVIGHTFDGDAKALNDECQRYGLDSLDYDFIDVRELYKKVAETDRSVGVVGILEELGIQGEENEHDAETDAFNTMLILKALCEKMNSSIDGVTEVYPELRDRTENFVVRSVYENRCKRIEMTVAWFNGEENELKLSNKRRGRLYNAFMNLLEKEERTGTAFLGKRLSFNERYVAKNFRRALRIIQFFVLAGGSVSHMVSTVDYYVRYDVYNEDGTLKKDSRLLCVQGENENGASIRILTVEELYGVLGLTEEEIDAMPLFTLDFITDVENGTADTSEGSGEGEDSGATNGRRKDSVVYSTGNGSSTLGDAIGHVLKKLK